MSVTIAVNHASWFFSPSTWRVNGSTNATTVDAGAYIKLTFSGTSAKLNVDTSVLAGGGVSALSYPTLRWSVDGGTATRYQLVSTDTQVTLATGLSAGLHQLRIDYVAIAATSDQWADPPLMGLIVTGLELDTAATLFPTSLLDGRMLYYGDSNTDGPEVFAAGTTAANMDASVTYGALMATRLGCEYGAIGFGGQGYGVGGQQGVPEPILSYDLYYQGHSRLSGGLFSPAPDYVVFDWGINQSGQTAGKVTAMIQAARAAAPSAVILVCIPWNGDSIATITSGFNTAADGNSQLLNTGETGYASHAPLHLSSSQPFSSGVGHFEYGHDLLGVMSGVSAVPTFIFNEGLKQLSSGGTVTWASDTIKARLVDSAIAPDIDAVSMTGIVGVGTDGTVGGKSKTTDTVNDRVVFSASSQTYTALTGNEVGSLVVYKFVTNDAGSIPLFCLALTPFTPDGTDHTVTFSATTGMGYTQQ